MNLTSFWRRFEVELRQTRPDMAAWCAEYAQAEEGNGWEPSAVIAAAKRSHIIFGIIENKDPPEIVMADAPQCWREQWDDVGCLKEPEWFPEWRKDGYVMPTDPAVLWLEVKP